MSIESAILIEITDLNSKAFHQSMNLYEKLFPPEERKSLVRLKQLLAQGTYRLWVLDKQDGLVIGFALIMEHDEPGFLFIDNIAIDTIHQGQGLGGHLIRLLAARQEKGSRGVFLEVEKPELALDPADHHARINRINFYSRLGFIPMADIDYLFPVAGGEPIPLLLLFKPAPGVKELSADTLLQMITAVYNNLHADVENRQKILESYAHTICTQSFKMSTSW